MSVALIWTIILVSIGVTGLWLAPKYWWGWVFNACGEMLWLIYAITINSPALAVMSCIYFFVYSRNTYVSRRDRDNFGS